MIKIKAKVRMLKHQYDFAMDKGKYLAMVGGYGSGKSFADVYRGNELIRWRCSRGEYPVILVTSPTFRLLEDVNIPRFEAFMNKYRVHYTFQKSKHKMIIKSGTLKGEYWFRSAVNYERIVGFDATDAIMDEHDTLRRSEQEAVWIKVMARLRGAKDATLAISTTPEGFKQTHQKFVEEKIGRLIKAKTSDNIFLPPDYIESLYNQFDKLLVQQYVNAEFVNINRLAAYYAFNRELLIDKYKPVTQTILVGVDFNVDPMTATIAEQVFEDGRLMLYVYDEIYLKDSNTYRMVEQILQRHPGKRVICFPDMTGGNRKSSATFTDIVILKKAGFEIRGINNPRVKDRLNTVNNLFDKKGVKIVKTLKYLIRDFEQVGVDEYGELDKKNLELTHCSDNFGYLVFRLYPLMKRNTFTAQNI